MILPPADIEETIQWAAAQAKIPAAIVRSVAYHESRYNPRARSPAGALGLMQLMPVNISSYNVTDPFDPDQSARVGAEMLRKLKSRHKTWPKALAAYVWGTGNVKKKPSRAQWPKRVCSYVDKVLRGANLKTFIPNEATTNAGALLLAAIPVILALARRYS